MTLASLMNWKASALLSGTVLVAGYFAAPTSRLPGGLMPAQPRDAAGPPPAASDIVAQAERLEARLRREALYREPARNPFRFAERRAAPRPEPGAEPLPPLPEVPAAPAPLPLPIRLAGVAIDGDVRTAILSTPSGVILARAGDEALGFRVSRIADESVTLVNPASGAELTLQLAP
jgi:hypothetical protein